MAIILPLFLSLLTPLRVYDALLRIMKLGMDLLIRRLMMDWCLNLLITR